MPPKKKVAKKKRPKKAVPKLAPQTLIPDQLAPLVIRLRRENVILDADIAELYGVETKVLNQAVRRNADRFPTDFMFQLREEEFENLRSQTVTSSSHGGRRTLPYAFTEQGVAIKQLITADNKSGKELGFHTINKK